MTANQLAYLNLQETKRNNVVTNIESRRHNLASELEQHRGNTLTYKSSNKRVKEDRRYHKAQVKEDKRSHKAQEKLQRRGQDVSARNTAVSAAAQRASAEASAAATRYAAYTSAQAARYAAQQNANASRFASLVGAQNVDRQNQTKKDIAELDRDMQQYSKGIDLLIAQVKSGNEKAKLRQAKKEYELAVKRYKLDRTTKTWDMVLKTGRQLENLQKSIGAGVARAVR